MPTEMPMQHFESKALHRTFEVIYFADRVTPADAAGKGGAALPAGHPPILPAGHPALPAGKGGLPAGHVPISGTGATVRVDLTGIQRPQGGRTVAEIHAQSAGLAGQEVVVRGKVVKYNAEIMGRNWLHIQDGSAEGAAGDLALTSKTAAKLGDLVLVSGVVATNRDFGAGYKYAVIVEDAKVVVESP